MHGKANAQLVHTTFHTMSKYTLVTCQGYKRAMDMMASHAACGCKCSVHACIVYLPDADSESTVLYHLNNLIIIKLDTCPLVCAYRLLCLYHIVICDISVTVKEYHSVQPSMAR